MPTISMTAQWVERVKAPAEVSQVDFFDDRTPGFGLRVSGTGRKSWVLLYRAKGDATKRRLTLGTYPALTLADAREKARAHLVDVDRGNDPGAERQEERKAPTFEAIAAEYIERYAKAEKRSWREDERILKQDVLPVFGRLKAHDVRRRDVVALLDGIKDRGAPIAANRTLALVRKVYNWGIERDMVQANPCAQVKPVSAEHQRDRVLNEEEIRAVWRAFEAEGTVICTMFKIRLLTAQRGGEVESMRWADLELENGWWTIPAAEAKNGLSHRVPLAAPVLALLRNLQAVTGQQEWAFPSPRRAVGHIANIQKAAARIQAGSGVDFVMHDLRRTAASHMTSLGIPRLVVSKLLNHAEGGVTRVYDRHSYDGEKRQAMDTWATRLLAILVEPVKTIPTAATMERTA